MSGGWNEAQGRLHLRLLTTPFVVRCDDPAVMDICRRNFASLASEVGPPVVEIELTAAPRPGELAVLSRNGEFVRAAQTLEGLIVPLGNELNRIAVANSAEVTVHAGAVSHEGMAMVLPADQESGKTTLTTALVAAGFDYLTDEAAAFDPRQQSIRPYPKPLFLDPGSWPLFPWLEPQAAVGTCDYKLEQWHVPPEAIRPGSVGSRCPVAWFVFPKYDPSRPTSMSRISRAEALIELTRNTFAFSDRPKENLDVLSDVVRGASCLRLSVDDLDEAVHLLSDLVQDREGVPCPQP